MTNSRDTAALHPAARRGAEEFLKRCKAEGLNVLVTQTYRDSEYQDSLYAQGRSRPGAVVTNCRGGRSMHNYGLAFDICKNARGAEYSDAGFFAAAGRIWQGMGGVWGGSWSGFVDRPHMEFTGGLKLAQLIAGQRPDGARMAWEKAAAPAPAPAGAGGDRASEANLAAMVSAGVMLSPGYWREQSIQYFDMLLANAARPGALDARVDNGIADAGTALKVLKDAGIMASPEYWGARIELGTVDHLGDLVINMANRSRNVLERIMHAEAQGEGLRGQVLVGNVIMNRCRSGGFPGGIYDVVHQCTRKDGKAAYQFSPVGDGAYGRAAPSAQARQAADAVLAGEDYSLGALYFCTRAAAPGSWHERALTRLFTHGNHVFYK